jgi:hypothetical protein
MAQRLSGSVLSGFGAIATYETGRVEVMLRSGNKRRL